MTITEKVSYIRGLAEGLELDASQKEVKVLNAVIDALEEIARTVTGMEDDLTEVQGQTDEIDEDLGSLERFVYDLPDDDEDEHDGCCCDDDEDEDAYYEVTCPNCHETICLSSDLMEDGEMECPNCGELLEFDFSEDEDEDDDAVSTPEVQPEN